MSRDVPFKMNQIAIGFEQWKYATPGALSFQHLPNLLRVHRRFLGHKSRQGLADNLGMRPAKEITHRGIRLKVSQMLIEQQNTAGRIIKDRLELRLALAHFIFGAARSQKGINRCDQYRWFDWMRQIAVTAGVKTFRFVNLLDEGR